MLLVHYQLYQYDGYCTKEEYNSIHNQVISARENAESVIKTCLRQLDNRPYKALNPTLFKNIVDKSNWKYKSFDATLTKPQKQMKSKQYPYEVYVLRKRVNLSSESSQLYSGEAVNLIQEKTRGHAVTWSRGHIWFFDCFAW